APPPRCRPAPGAARRRKSGSTREGTWLPPVKNDTFQCGAATLVKLAATTIDPSGATATGPPEAEALGKPGRFWKTIGGPWTRPLTPKPGSGAPRAVRRATA